MPTQRGPWSPTCPCHAAYLSPSSGIVDSHALTLAYQADLERTGRSCRLRAPVEGARSPRMEFASTSAAASSCLRDARTRECGGARRPSFASLLACRRHWYRGHITAATGLCPGSAGFFFRKLRGPPKWSGCCSPLLTGRDLPIRRQLHGVTTSKCQDVGQ
jgi:hypothetical protein